MDYATAREVRVAFADIASRTAAIGISYGSAAEKLYPARRSHAYAAIDLLRDGRDATDKMIAALEAIADRLPP